MPQMRSCTWVLVALASCEHALALRAVGDDISMFQQEDNEPDEEPPLSSMGFEEPLLSDKGPSKMALLQQEDSQLVEDPPSSSTEFDGIQSPDGAPVSETDRKEMTDFKTFAQKGMDVEKTISCAELQEHMSMLTDLVIESLHAHCDLGSCNFAELDVDKLVQQQGQVTALAAAADKNRCLKEVMGSPEVGQKVASLLSFVPQALEAVEAQEGKDRLQETYLQLVTFQQGILGLEDQMADRKLLLGVDYPEESCPQPCQKCDRRHASVYGFRCLLKRGDKKKDPEMHERHGLTCRNATRRWFRWYPFARQCEVADWKEMVVQHVHVSAVLSCAVTTMLMGMNTELSELMRRYLHDTCVKLEQGSNITEWEEKTYTRRLNSVDDAIDRNTKLAFSVIITYGMASGVAGLRAATHGNERKPVFLEGVSALAPEDFTAPYAAFLTTEVREEDRAMYGNREVFGRKSTLDRIDSCSEVYNLRSQNTFLDGTRALVVSSMQMKEGEMSLQEATKKEEGEGKSVLAQAYGAFGTVAGIALTFISASLLYYWMLWTTTVEIATGATLTASIPGLLMRIFGFVATTGLTGVMIWGTIGALTAAVVGRAVGDNLGKCMNSTALAAASSL